MDSDLGRAAGVSNDTLGLAHQAEALVVFDDGTGPALYAAGRFTSAGGVPAAGIARWDGAGWSGLGQGLGGGPKPWAYALAVFDDGTGPALYAAGGFTTAGGVAANRVARWDGKVWSPLGSGLDGTVHALAVYDDGHGPALHAGGDFHAAGAAPAAKVARWDGASWSSLGGGIEGLNTSVHALAVHDDGSGPALYVAGDFAYADDVLVGGIARWDGGVKTAWLRRRCSWLSAP